MNNKWLACTAILVCAMIILFTSPAHGSKKNSPLSAGKIKLGKSKLIDKTTVLKFFEPIKNNEENTDDQSQEPIAIIRYSWTTDHKTLYLDFFKIEAREHRKKGLGKQIFTYFINYLRKKERKATTLMWTAQTLDLEYMSQETLEAFYTSLGGVKLYSEVCSNHDCTCESPIKSRFILEIKDFISHDTSSLSKFDIIEESNTTRIKILALAD